MDPNGQLQLGQGRSVLAGVLLFSGFPGSCSLEFCVQCLSTSNQSALVCECECVSTRRQEVFPPLLCSVPSCYSVLCYAALVSLPVT